MHVVRVKASVRFDHIAPAGFVVLAAIHSATVVLGADLMITCGTDSHPADDPHTLGEAYDVSVATFTVDELLTARAFFLKALGPAFTVLYESPFVPSDARLAAIATINPAATAPHLHVQRKKGTVYPPAPPSSLA